MMALPSLSLFGVFQQVGNHLWQSTLCLAAVALLTLACRDNRAHVRHWLWLAASVKFLVPFAPLMAIGGQFGRHSHATMQPQMSFLVGTVSQPFSRSAFQPAAVASAGAWIHRLWTGAPALLVGIWFLGGAVVLLRWYAGWRRVSAAVRQGRPIENGREVDTLRRLERMHGLNRSIAIIVSNRSFEPGVFGIAKPVLLWPHDIGEHLDDGHLEAILAHEVCHVRRRDNLAVAVHMFVEALFWFHPLIWWIERRLVDERERACDEEVIRWGSQPHVYAESILKTCECYIGSPPFACLSCVTGSDLKKRIEAIMTNGTTHALTTAKSVLLASAGIAAVAGPLVVGLLSAPHIHAQSPALVAQSRPAVRRGALTIELASITRNMSAQPVLAQRTALAAAPVAAQQSPLAARTTPTAVCGFPIPTPVALPPAGSGPVVLYVAPCFEAQGNRTIVPPETYLSYIQLKPSRPSAGVWAPYDETAEKTVAEDSHRLWDSNLLDNLRIDVTDYTFSNGVVGKIVVYNMEERRRPARQVGAIDSPAPANPPSSQFGPEIQFDTKGVEFGPWVRRFITQVKSNWLIPYAAATVSKGHVVVQFNVHKDGSITDLAIGAPSSIDSFNDAALNALTASNPVPPLPPDYPEEKVFFRVTFFYNESAGQTSPAPAK